MSNCKPLIRTPTPRPRDPELKKLRGLSPGELADEAGKLKAALGQIKDEAIRRELTRAEGNLYRLTLSPPGRQTRLDRTRLEADKGAAFLAPYLYETDTDWVMRCNARRGLA
jgi:hypothetical protein